MIGEFQRGQTIDLSIIFISNVTGELIDPENPTVEVSHYDGVTEVIDLVETPLVKIATRPKGHYTYAFAIPTSFVLNEIYYVRWRGKDLNSCTDTIDILENHFKVVGPTGTGDCCGLVPRFTSC